MDGMVHTEAGEISGFSGTFLREIPYNVKNCQKLTGLVTMMFNMLPDSINGTLGSSLCSLQAAPAGYFITSGHRG
jgi:hypothetical protein